MPVYFNLNKLLLPPTKVKISYSISPGNLFLCIFSLHSRILIVSDKFNPGKYVHRASDQPFQREIYGNNVIFF